MQLGAPRQSLARRCRFHPRSSILDPRSSTATWNQAHPRAGTDSKRIGPPGSPRFAARRAFTIIELLVVITIIAVLMTLVISVVGAFITQARDAATKTTIGKIQGLTNSRAQAFSRLIVPRRMYVPGTVEMQYVNSNYPALSPSAKTTIATKLLEKKFFPQRINELVQPLDFNPAMRRNIYEKYMAIFSQSQPPGQNISNLSQYLPALDLNNHTLRSSEILYDFLTQSNVLGDSPAATDAFSDAEVKDTDGNGLPEFIDAWGNPLRFYRWPTRLFRSGGAVNGAPYVANFTQNDIDNAKLLFSSLPVFSGNLAIVGTPRGDLARDPDDPLQNFLNSPSLTSVQFEQLFHTPVTYHVLLIVSAGPDGQLGIYEPDLVDIQNNILGNLAQPIPGQQDALADNITYLNVRAGGK